MNLTEKQKAKKIAKFRKKYKIGLCLSGGGTKGFAYLGAFKAFEEMGITFDAVAGTSAGALFGAVYASQMPLEKVFALVKDLKNKDFRKSQLGFLPSKMDKLEENINNVFTVDNIEDFIIPLYVVAVDLKSGQEVHFSKGNLAKILTGSCAIPGIFCPVDYEDLTLIDGGVLNNIPADVLKENGCDYIVTIDCNCSRGGGTEKKNLITQFVTSIGIMMVNNSKQGKLLSDLIICPNLKRYNSLNVKGCEDMIKEGYQETMRMMPEIENLLLGKLKKK